MDKSFIRTAKILSVVIFVIAVVLQIFIMIYTEGSGVTNKGLEATLNYFSVFSYIVVVFSILLALLFPVAQTFSKPRILLRLLIFLVAIVVVGFLCYTFEPYSFSQEKLQKLNTTAEVTRLVGAGLIFTYLIAGVAFLSIVYTGIRSIVNK
jgi:hypothetical protein